MVASNALKRFSTFYLKTLPYKKAYNLQKLLTNWHITSPKQAQSVMLLLEHSPVYTVGLRSSVYDESEETRLKNLGADFFRSDRGGLITFHGPGQLVVYPIFDMTRAGLGVKRYVDSLEETIIQLLHKRYQLEGERSPHTGVWIGNNKICAMGINIQRRIASHGIALNCDIDLRWFSHIVACGIHGKGVTSLSKEASSQVQVSHLLQPFVSTFEETFDWKSSAPITTLDPELSNDELLEMIKELSNK